MSSMRAVVVADGAAARLALEMVDVPSPGESEVLVRVAAVSLNRGEVRRAQVDEAGHRPGWDLSGTVEKAAADGSGPSQGARVVGHVRSAAWAEMASVATDSVAELPEGVSFAQAATLPTAGLTALYGLDKAHGLVGRRALVTGASGGAGHFGVQLARRGGAHVVALVRRPEHEGMVREAGAHEVVVSEDGSDAGDHAPYEFVLDGVGGPVLGNALRMLAANAVCVTYGMSASTEVRLDLDGFS